MASSLGFVAGRGDSPRQRNREGQQLANAFPFAGETVLLFRGFGINSFFPMNLLSISRDLLEEKLK